MRRRPLDGVGSTAPWHGRPAMRIGALVPLGVAVLLGGCAQSGAPVDPNDPGVVHVHGLAPHPTQSEVLLAATHTGLFSVEDGAAERIGDGWHDLMAFTVSTDGVLFASGHPDLASSALRSTEGDPHLGLVRSTDRGETWQPVSLLGSVDFHAMTLAGPEILAADATSGDLLASDDGGREWERRSRLPLMSIVGHPTEARVVVGSTADGLFRSEDAGRTWAKVSGTQPGYVGAATELGFVVAEENGTVAVSRDGIDWRAVGELPGTPEALAGGDGQRLYAAVTGHGVFRSVDGGGSWELLYDPAGA